jgi:hypothetical protein
MKAPRAAMACKPAWYRLIACVHLLLQIEERLSGISKALRGLPEAKTREQVADYVRHHLEEMSWALRSIAESTDVGGDGDTYTTDVRELISVMSRYGLWDGVQVAVASLCS